MSIGEGLDVSMTPEDFARFAESAVLHELDDPVLQAVGRVWLLRASSKSVPGSAAATTRMQRLVPGRMSLGTAAVWTAIRLGRDRGSVLWAPWSCVIRELAWENVDVDAILGRVEVEEPSVLPIALGLAVDAGVLKPDGALVRVVACWGTTPRAVADELVRPWTRAAPFPEDLFWTLSKQPDWRDVSVALAVHWRHPALMTAVGTLPGGWRFRALAAVATEHLDVEVLERLARTPQARVAALAALGRAVDGPHRWSPDLSLLLEAIHTHGGEVLSHVASLLRHHESAWCAHVAQIPFSEPVWHHLAELLHRLNHPDATALLERMWEEPSFPNDGLVHLLAERGSACVFDAAVHHEEALSWLPPSASAEVESAFDESPSPSLAAWIARHCDGPPGPHVVERLSAADMSTLFVGYPDEACHTLLAVARDPTNPAASAAIEQLGAFAPSYWAGELLDLVLNVPAGRAGMRTLADDAWDALLQMERRERARGHRRSLVGTRLVRWVERAAIDDGALPKALERLLELEVAPSNLAKMVRLGSSDVRKHAIRLLGRLGLAKQATPFLHHDDPKLRRAASDALGNKRWADVELASLLTTKNMNVRRSAAVALRDTENPAVLPALRRVASTNDHPGLLAEVGAAGRHIAGLAWPLPSGRAAATSDLVAVPSFDPRLAEVRALPIAQRLPKLVELGVAFTAEERGMANDPRASVVWKHGIGDRLAANEIDNGELCSLLGGIHAPEAADRLLDRGERELLLREAPVLAQRRWRGSPDTTELLVAADAWAWRLDRGDLSHVDAIRLLRGGPEQRVLGIKWLMASPCAVEDLLPLLSEGPNPARAAATLLQRWGGTACEDALEEAFLAGRIRTAPRLTRVPSHHAPVPAVVSLLSASRTSPAERRVFLEAVPSNGPADRLALRRGWADLPAWLFVDDALRGAALPDRVRAYGDVPDALVDALDDDPPAAVLELLGHWSTLSDGRDRLPDVLERCAACSWTPDLVVRLEHWRRAPLRAVEVALRVAEHHALDLREPLSNVPPTQRTEVLLSLAPVMDVDEWLLDALLPLAGRPFVEPFEALPAKRRTRMWARVYTWAASRDVEQARRALWALAPREDGEQVLVQAHTHPNRRVRVYANRLLRRFGFKASWLDGCLVLLDDSSLRRSMLRTLAYQRHRASIPRMVELLARNRTACHARDALLAFGEEAVTDLEILLPRLRPDRRAAVRDVLATLRGES